ncbi:hypothetical protein U5B43_07430 [Campylobacter sp. 9BO]|uniref:hypothetical protein n=1 Tax=Campylobacter sp. 9BO TaxID=3424759 RepID=UPI003D325C8C
MIFTKNSEQLLKNIFWIANNIYLIMNLFNIIFAVNSKKDLNCYLGLPYHHYKKLDDDDCLCGMRIQDLQRIIQWLAAVKNETKAINDLKEVFACYIKNALQNGKSIYEPIDKNTKVRINLTMPKGILNTINTVTITARHG